MFQASAGEYTENYADRARAATITDVDSTRSYPCPVAAAGRSEPTGNPDRGSDPACKGVCRV